MTARKNQKIAKLVEKYGDLIFDLCESMLGNSALAQLAFRSIIKKIRLELNRSSYEAYERSWVLKLASQQLLALVRRRGEVVEPKRQFEIDSHAENQNQTQKLDFYFRRLRPELQLLLLLKEKHRLPTDEISAALGTPIDTLKLQRGQALKALEEWMWTKI